MLMQWLHLETQWLRQRQRTQQIVVHRLVTPVVDLAVASPVVNLGAIPLDQAQIQQGGLQRAMLLADLAVVLKEANPVVTLLDPVLIQQEDLQLVTLLVDLVAV